MKPRVAIGLTVFFLMMVSMYFAAGPIQNAWGMWGLALTEILLLAWAIIPALLLKWDFREVFRIRVPAWRQVFGTLVLWLGGYIAIIATTMIISYIFPKGMSNVSTGLLDFFMTVPFPVRLFIMAVMPAICEEALHRGFILYTFKNTGKWTAIISMAFIFGFFHLDPYRFLGTAILGAVLTYVMVETKNILLPMLLHFAHNAFISFTTLVTTPSTEVLEIPLASVGVLIITATVVPFLFIGGSRLLLSREERIYRPISKPTWIIAIVMSAVLALSGIALFGVGIADLMKDNMAEPIIETSISMGVNKDTPGHQLEFTAEKAKSYYLDLSIDGEDGVLTRVTIVSQSGEEIYDATAGSMTGQGHIDLVEGDYIVTISYLTESQEYLSVNVDILIK